MDAAGWIVAGYAAIVSTAGLAWQVYAWRMARKNRVEVSVSAAVVAPAEGTFQAVSISVVNRSDHAVRVTGVGLAFQDESRQQFHLFRPPQGATIPGVVKSHDSGSTYISNADVESGSTIDVYEPITGWVRLATGEIVKSKPTTILSRS
jgi:proteasome lid subunit RPN8/RPN11